MNYSHVIAFVALTSITFLHANLTWSDATINGSSNSWNAVAFGEGNFVAVNGFGEIATSTDGGETFNETGDYSADFVIFDDVEYGTIRPGVDGFLAAGVRLGSQARIYESTDGGHSWTEATGNYTIFAGQRSNDIAVGTND